MSYSNSVVASITQSTAAASTSNLNCSMFISDHAFFKERVRGYSSLAEVTADGIPTDSSLYKAFQKAFSVDNPCVPIYSGRREIDSILMTPTVENSTTYSVTVQAKEIATGDMSETYVTSFDSDVDATAEEICAGIAAATALPSAMPSSVATIVDNLDGTVTVTGGAGQQIIVTSVEGFSQEFTSTESAADCYAAITDENNSDYYFITAESRDLTFIKDLSAAVATSTGSYPKMYGTSSDALASLAPVEASAVAGDTLQAIQDEQYSRTFGIWTQNSEDTFNELATCVAAGGFQAGAVNWKFLQKTDTDAFYTAKGRKLSTAEMGYLGDRNASWVSTELGLTFLHGGKLANGNWIDQQIIADWTRVEMESRVLTTLVNANTSGEPITGTATKLDLIAGRIESVLTDGVELGLFSGYLPPVMPTTISFADQAARILDNISFTAYFAIKINFVLIDGNLTYSEEVQ